MNLTIAELNKIGAEKKQNVEAIKTLQKRNGVIRGILKDNRTTLVKEEKKASLKAKFAKCGLTKDEIKALLV
jgi:hypothetical protein